MYASNKVSLPPSEPRESAGLFLSIFPDLPTAAQMAQVALNLRRSYRLSGRPHLTTRFHCSLYSFDSVPPAIAAKPKAAAATVKAAPFRVSFNCAKSFSDRPGRHPLVLIGDDGLVGLTMLCSSLGAALRNVPFRPNGRPVLTPHVTLLYDGCRIDEQPIEPICWTVGELVLLRSLIGQTKHVRLGQWLLRG
jgi:RNA 2',3'-cyclic 3'-phosphodiesterase